MQKGTSSRNARSNNESIARMEWTSPRYLLDVNAETQVRTDICFERRRMKDGSEVYAVMAYLHDKDDVYMGFTEYLVIGSMKRWLAYNKLENDMLDVLEQEQNASKRAI